MSNQLKILSSIKTFILVKDCFATWRRLKNAYHVENMKRFKENNTGSGKQPQRQHFEHYNRVKEIVDPQEFKRR